MTIINFLRRFFKQLFGGGSLQGQDREPSNLYRHNIKEPDVYFRSLTVMEKTPKNDSIGDRDFVTVVFKGKPVWALFRCPCGCGHVVSLSLQRTHNPRWSVNKTQKGRPTIYPSIWQNQGCCSHFWIRDGRVYWCEKVVAQ